MPDGRVEAARRKMREEIAAAKEKHWYGIDTADAAEILGHAKAARVPWQDVVEALKQAGMTDHDIGIARFSARY